MSEAKLVPPSGHQSVEDSLLQEAVSLYFEKTEGDCSGHNKKRVEFEPTIGGVNNITRFVTVRKSGDRELLSSWRFVLRIYNNGRNTERVQFEHCVLAALNELIAEKKDCGWLCRTPRAILSLRNRPFEVLSSGAAVCMFEVIPGTLASTTSPYDVGRAAGRLSRQLAVITPRLRKYFVKDGGDCPTAPYWKIWDVHHTIRSRETFHSIVAAHRSDWFASCADVIDELNARIDQVLAICTSQFASILPTQLIHGDLHYDNVLVEPAIGSSDGAKSSFVRGILDFEFSAFDWRAMELAICLSKYLSEPDPLSLCRSFVEGYLSNDDTDEKVFGVCATPLVNVDECNALPSLIALRVLSNVVYFVGRAKAGEDSVMSLTSRAVSYLKRLRWIDNNAVALRETVACCVTEINGKHEK